MVDVVKRKVSAVADAGAGLVRIDMVAISLLAFSTALPPTTSVATGATLTLTVALSGGLDPKKLQWYKDGNAIAGATGLVYSKASAAAADAGVYKVVASDAYGSILAGSTTVSVT